MKVMLMWPTRDPEVKILLDTLTEAGHEVVYWVGEDLVRDLSPRGAIFHEHYEALTSKPASTFVSTLIPPASMKLITGHFELESTVLTMMNKHYDKVTLDERKQIYYDMLAYWSFVIEKIRPDAVLFTTVPHSVYDFVVYSIAKAKGIRTLMFEDSWVAGRLIWFTDYKKGSEAFAAALAKNSHTTVSSDKLEADLRKYFETQTKSHVKPFYMQVQQEQDQVLNLARHRLRVGMRAIRSGTFFNLLTSFVHSRFKKDLRDEYTSVMRQPDYEKPFVYFPLGFQPERTTSPQGDVFCDQILAVQTAATALPEGWELYVKEHPSQWWLRSKTKYNSVRYEGYYRRLSAIPRVRLVPIHTDTHQLIAACKTVAIVTGTAGWESIFKLKKPLVFGYPWYVPSNLMFRVKSTDDCIAAYRDIQRGSKIKNEDLLRLLKSLEESTMRAYVAPLRDQVGRVFYDDATSLEENMHKVARRACEELSCS